MNLEIYKSDNEFEDSDKSILKTEQSGQENEGECKQCAIDLELGKNGEYDGYNCSKCGKVLWEEDVDVSNC